MATEEKYLKPDSKGRIQLGRRAKNIVRYKVIEENEGGFPNHTTIKAINEARKGKTVKCSNFEEYLEKVK